MQRGLVACHNLGIPEALSGDGCRGDNLSTQTAQSVGHALDPDHLAIALRDQHHCLLLQSPHNQWTGSLFIAAQQMDKQSLAHVQYSQPCSCMRNHSRRWGFLYFDVALVGT